MKRKTQNKNKKLEKRKKKTTKKKRRGGKQKGDWEKGFWSEEPTIHAKFRTEKGQKKECEYSLKWVYHYLEEDDSVPLEKKKEGEKEEKIKKREFLQLFTNSEAMDNKRTKNSDPQKTENEKYRNCVLTEKEVLAFIKSNSSFQEKIDNGKRAIEEMVKVDQEQNALIKSLDSNVEIPNKKEKDMSDKMEDIKKVYATKKK
jgi:hypothetical protein